MGLACSNIRLLTLTARKADCEYNISIDSIEKMALTREQSDLSKEYYSRLQARQLSYYADGKYGKVNYGYLMGYGANYMPITTGSAVLKNNNSTILTDSKGAVVLSSEYAGAITKVLGSSIMNAKGQGGTFSVNDIPKILAELLGSGFDEETITKVYNGEEIESSYEADVYNTMSMENQNRTVTIDNTLANTELIASVIDFYWPIFQAAAANGWTTEYNEEIGLNDDYISDALNSGIFQIATVLCDGSYDPDTSLTYFITSGLVYERSDSDTREEINAWYNAEKDRISEKETILDIEIKDLSTELEAINTEIDSVKSLIEDSEKAFSWGTNG